MLKRPLALILSVVLVSPLCLASVIAVKTSSQSAADSITEPYEYPVAPGTQEWAEMDSLAEKAAACAVDEDTLAAMSTPALVETVLSYPLLANIYAYNTVEEGVASVSQYFGGIQALQDREDAQAYLSDCLETQSPSAENGGDLTRACYLSALYQYLTQA